MMRFSSPGQRRRHFHSPPGREGSHVTEEYATVKAVLAQRTDLAILLTREDLLQPVWVPKRRLNISSRLAAERTPLKDEISVSVDLAFALEHKLV